MNTRLPDLPHLSAQLYGRAHLIAPTKLETILEVVSVKADQIGLSSERPALVDEREDLEQSGSIAVIPIVGTLVNRHSHVSAASGLTSYSDIANALNAALQNQQVQAILLDIDSPGGEASGCFDLVDQIYAARDTKPIWASVNDSALSAAYAIASACERIHVTRTGSVGSIGVVAAHVDQSKANDAAGLKHTFIKAGVRKTDGNPHEPLKPEAANQIQFEVDRIYELFVETVARNRGLKADVVRQTEAGIYGGGQGVTHCLADGVKPFSQTLSDLTAFAARPPMKRVTPLNDKEPQLMDDPNPNDQTPETTFEASKNTQSQTSPATVVTTTATSADKPASSVTSPTSNTPVSSTPVSTDAAAIEKTLRAQYAEISAIAGQAAKLGITVDVPTALENKLTPTALRKQVLDSLAARDETTAVVATPVQETANTEGETASMNAGSGLKAAAQAEAKAMMGETTYG